LTPVPFDHLERSGANRRAVVRNAVEVVILRQQVAWVDRIRRRRHGEERADERRERMIEVDDRGEPVGRVDPRDVVVALPAADVVVRVHHRVPREHDVAHVERRSVLPRHALAQVIGNRPPVARDPAVRQARHDGRKLGHQLVGIAVVEQVAGPEHR
jgi:hypothetical protein